MLHVIKARMQNLRTSASLSLSESHGTCHAKNLVSWFLLIETQVMFASDLRVLGGRSVTGPSPGSDRVKTDTVDSGFVFAWEFRNEENFQGLRQTLLSSPVATNRNLVCSRGLHGEVVDRTMTRDS